MSRSDFVLPVDKPEGPTSHDVVSAARRSLGVKRVGHTGTLDPFASGLLLLCVGRATRLAEYFSGLDKAYEAVARMGVRTDTLDRDGNVVGQSGGWQELTAEKIDSALAAFRGRIDQIPPAYSAKKVAGERAYRRARAGEGVELEACPVTVHELVLTSLDLPLLGFRVHCTAGTYVRALARDIGDALGVGAHLTALRRTAIGAWSVEDALPLDALADGDRVAEAAVAPLDAVGHLPRVDVDDALAERLALGQAVGLPDGDEEPGTSAPVAVAHRGALLAIAEADGGRLMPRKVFAA